MTQVVTGTNHPFLLQWCASKVTEHKDLFNPDTARACALLDENGTPIVAAVFDGWTEHWVEGSIASDGSKRWANRRFIEATYRYVFERCGKQRLHMVVAVDNTPAINMHTALGHVREGRLRDWNGVGKDAFIYSFTKTDWQSSKWNRQRREDNNDGQISTSSTAST